MLSREVTFVLGAVVIVAIMGLSRLGLQAPRVAPRQPLRFACPHLQIPVDCELIQDPRTGQWTDVWSCTLFYHPEQVDCDQACVRRLNRELPRQV